MAVEKGGMNPKIRTLCLGLGLAFTLTVVESTRAAEDAAGTKSESIRFKRAAWKAGDAITSKLAVDGTLSVTMSVRGEVVQTFEQTSQERTHKKNVVLAAGEDGPSKISVHYEELVETQHGSEGEEGDEEATSPLSGRTFVLEQGAKAVTVTDDDGTVVSGDLAALVREKELSRDGSFEHGFDRLALLVSESPRKVGEKIRVPEELALEIAGSDDELKDGSMSLELRELRDVDGQLCGVFLADIKLTGAPDDGEYKTVIELQGEILIQVEGARFVKAELAGQVTVNGAVSTEDTTVTISGSGPLKIVETAAHSRERS